MRMAPKRDGLFFDCVPTASDRDTTVLRDLKALDEFRRRATGDLYLLGSGQVITTLTGANLVDEFQVFVSPVVLGGGTPFFPPHAQRLDLDLIETRTFGSRVVYLRYARA